MVVVVVVVCGVGECVVVVVVAVGWLVGKLAGWLAAWLVGNSKRWCDENGCIRSSEYQRT